MSGIHDFSIASIDELEKILNHVSFPLCPNNAYVKPKHLSTSGGNGAKFLGGSKVESEVILREGLKNGTIKTIADSGITKLWSQSYEIIVDAGKVVGTKGEALIKVVLSEDGGMLSAYPVK